MSPLPLDMRAGTHTALGRVVAVFGAAHPHHAYIFTNRRGDRMKVLIHDGIGIWLAARRLNQGSFVRLGWADPARLSPTQFDALVLGLPWQRVGEAGVITPRVKIPVVSIDSKWGAQMRERVGSIRTRIQRPSGSAHAAAGERIAGGGVA
nr:IS66 family insertion sequence element accessory protein TnpB [Roseateles oligotrophus]